MLITPRALVKAVVTTVMLNVLVFLTGTVCVLSVQDVALLWETVAAELAVREETTLMQALIWGNFWVAVVMYAAFIGWLLYVAWSGVHDLIRYWR